MIIYNFINHSILLKSTELIPLITLQLEIKKIEEAAEKEKRAKQLQIDHLASMQVNQEKQINQVY